MRAIRLSRRAVGFALIAAGCLVVPSASAQTTTMAQKPKAAPTGAAVQATAPRNIAIKAYPDLKITAFDGVKATVKNVGTTDATAGATPVILLAGSPDVIPAGGKMAPQQQVLVNVGIVWDCDSVSNKTSAGHYASWPSNYVARPTDAAGYDMLLVDPTNAIAELNESNNAAFPLVRSNPLYDATDPKLPDFVVTSPRVWLDGKYVRFEWIDKNQGQGTGQFCTTRAATPGQPSYIGWNVYRVHIDGRSTALNSTSISSPWTVKPGEEKKVWDHSELVGTDQWGRSTGDIAAGCHEFKFIVDPDDQVKESNECNNAQVVYFATGGATCSADKKSGPASTCTAPTPTPSQPPAPTKIQKTAPEPMKSTPAVPAR